MGPQTAAEAGGGEETGAPRYVDPGRDESGYYLPYSEEKMDKCADGKRYRQRMVREKIRAQMLMMLQVKVS